MKRPEGFGADRHSAAPQPPARAPKERVQKPERAPKPARPLKAQRAPKPDPEPQRGAKPQGPKQKPARAPRIRQERASRPGAGSRSELAAAAQQRRRAERAELRRFTRRTRTRRIAFASVAGLLALLAGLVLVAVYSPLLALRTVVVQGTARIPAAEVEAALSGQLGTPLALLDFDRLNRELSAFPLIRTYSTEAVPPDTLIVRIVERQPVGQIAKGQGFALIDPAGVQIAESAERTAGYPFIDARGDLDSPAFASMVEVLLAMPPGLAATVDSVSATTQDDVTLVLSGVGQRVLWGSADESELKARVLERLIGVTDPSTPGVFDVSAPGTAVFRPL